MKKFISGLAFGVILMTAAFSFGADAEITALFTSFNFLVNGEAVQLETQPIVYNGTSYLPVRDLANVLGYDVTYQADTRTIELNVPETTLPETGIIEEKPAEEEITVDYIHTNDLSQYGINYSNVEVPHPTGGTAPGMKLEGNGASHIFDYRYITRGSAIGDERGGLVFSKQELLDLGLID